MIQVTTTIGRLLPGDVLSPEAGTVVISVDLDTPRRGTARVLTSHGPRYWRMRDAVGVERPEGGAKA